MFIRYLILVIVSFLWTPLLLAADLSGDQFHFKTFGMVCNQCAYGVEQSLQHTQGVVDVSVDLRAGDVVVSVNPSSPPSVERLIERLLDQRLSIASVECTLAGRLERTREGWQLIHGDQHYLIAHDKSASSLNDHAGQTVVISGIFEGLNGVENASGQQRLVLHQIAPD